MRQKFPNDLTYCNRTISKILKKIGYTKKKTYLSLVDQVYDKQLLQLRLEVGCEIASLLQQNYKLIMIDESSQYVNIKPTHGYSEKGKKIFVEQI